MQGLQVGQFRLGFDEMGLVDECVLHGVQYDLRVRLTCMGPITRINKLKDEGLLEISDCESLPTCEFYLLGKMTNGCHTY